MSATNQPFGLVPVGVNGSGVMNHRTRWYPIASNYGTAIFNGDIVELSGGNVTRSNQAVFTKALGVFLGCKYTNPTTKQPTWSNTYPASTVAADIFAQVADDPDQVYMIQLTAATTAASLGLNANPVTGTGSATTGKSGVRLDQSTITTTNTLLMRIVGLVNEPGNLWTDAFPKVIVMFNSGFHFFRQATGV